MVKFCQPILGMDILTKGKNKITHWSLETGKKINTFYMSTDRLEEIILSPDGLFFLTTTRVEGSITYDYIINSWSLESGKMLEVFPKQKIRNLLFLPESQIFLTRNLNKVKSWSPESGKAYTFEGHKGPIEKIITLSDSTFLTYCQSGWRRPVNNDFTIRYWNAKSGKLISVFQGHTKDITNLILLPNSDTFLTMSDDSTIRYWDLKLGKEIHTFQCFDEYMSTPILLSNDQSFLVGINNKVIEHYDLKSGNRLGLYKSRYGSIKSINFTSDSSKFFTKNQENSLTLWDFKSYQEICTLIPKVGNNKDFVLVTPDDYYFATKGGVDDLVHFVIEDEVYLFSQFDLQYNRPDIVLDRIGLASDTLIQTYKLAYQKRLQKMDFSEERIKVFMNGEFEKDFNAPEIELLGKGNSVREETTQSEYTFSFTATDAKYNIERIFVNVDGVPLYGAKGIILENPSRNLAKRKVKVPLIAGKNIITLSVINAQGVASLEKRLEITYNPPQPTKPTLYVFSIGVNEYQDEDITKLDYAVKDAEKVAEIFAQHQGDFVAVKKFTLTDAKVNKESVLKLRQELLKTKPEDMVIFNFAGHGFLDDSTNYYLGTYDTDLNNLAQTGLKYDEVESLLDGIPARKKLMFIDACHSGEVDKESVKGFQENKRTRKWTRDDGKIIEVNELSQTAFEVMKTSFSDLRIGTGTTVISASGGLEVATEDYTWGHGAFTYTLIQGLQEKKADLDKNGKITVSELQTYLADEVQRLTDGFQKPTSRIENIVNDFVVWE